MKVWLERSNGALLMADVEPVDGELPDVVAMQGTGRYVYFTRIANLSSYVEASYGWADNPRFLQQLQK